MLYRNFNKRIPYSIILCASIACGGNSASSGPTYEVPIVTAELADVAIFPVAEVHYGPRDGVMRLEYDLPAELVGIATPVEFEGPLEPPFELVGEAGTASCSESDGAVVCNESLPGVVVDPEAVRALFAGRGMAAAEIDRRVSVSTQFSSDPLGILRFDIADVTNDE